ncbi:F-box protein At3g07870-like [Lycium barbarum]|uniref:F-box protein At3g07870-like n=1 Tax=Lycium barbarum TaxID=112863 RepID=UPI00293E81FE|nr:F-box protein At3g07870-like [Lycium barbarum]
MDTQSDEAPPARCGFDWLSQEIVLNVASRLPITSLIQFTFVRKSFYNLSQNPKLVNSHLLRALKNDPCIIINADDQLYFLEFSDHRTEEGVVREISTPFANEMPKFDMVGSCHGLLCIRDCLLSDSLYVYNPFTRDYKELPKIQEKSLVYGFGFSPTTNEYKVIKIIHYNPLDHRKSDVQVLSLGSNKWRSVGEVVYKFDSFFQSGSYHRLIVSFDLPDEVFEEVPKFDFGVDPRSSEFQLAVLGDCLAIAITLPHQNGGGLGIWNGELLEYEGENLVLYDPQSGVLRTLRFQGMPKFFQIVVHVGCLNWIDIPDGIQAYRAEANSQDRTCM